MTPGTGEQSADLDADQLSDVTWNYEDILGR